MAGKPKGCCLLLLFLFFFLNASNAQNDPTGRIDSLIRLSEKVTLQASEVLLLAQHYYDEDSFALSRHFVSLAKKHPLYQNNVAFQSKLGILEGFILLYTGDPATAFTIMFESYQRSKIALNDTLKLRAAAGLGIISRKLGNYDKALRYFEEALESANLLSLPYEEVKLRNEIGSVFLLQKAPEKALAEYNKVRQMGISLNDSLLLSIANSNIGSVYTELKKYPEALAAFEENLETFGDYLGSKNRIVTMLNVGEICTRLSDFTKAGYYLSLAFDLSKRNGLPTLKMEALRRQSYLAERMGDHSHALNLFRDYTVLKDSLFSIEKQKQIHELESQYQLEQDQILLALYRQKMKNRNITIFIMILIVLALVLVYLFYRRTAMLRMKVKEAEKEQMLQQVELRNRELVSLALNLGQKSQLLVELEGFLNNLQALSKNAKIRSLLQEQRGKLMVNHYLDHNWDHFTRHFEQVHPQFFSQLKDQYPDLSSNDLIHCAFIKLLLKQKEVALILGINERSVQMTRYRLKKKMGLMPDDDLNSFVAGLGKSMVM